MASSIASVNNLQVPTTAGVAYTVGANVNAVIQKLAFTSEESSNTRLMTVYAVPGAGSPGATNTILYKKPVAPGPITDVPELVNFVLPGGYTLQVVCDAGTVVYMNAAFLLVS